MMGVCISQYKNNQTKKKNMKQSYDINNNDENFNGNMKMVLPYKTGEMKFIFHFHFTNKKVVFQRANSWTQSIGFWMKSNLV